MSFFVLLAHHDSGIRMCKHAFLGFRYFSVGVIGKIYHYNSKMQFNDFAIRQFQNLLFIITFGQDKIKSQEKSDMQKISRCCKMSFLFQKNLNIFCEMGRNIKSFEKQFWFFNYALHVIKLIVISMLHL